MHDGKLLSDYKESLPSDSVLQACGGLMFLSKPKILFSGFVVVVIAFLEGEGGEVLFMWGGKDLHVWSAPFCRCFGFGVIEHHSYLFHYLFLA